MLPAFEVLRKSRGHRMWMGDGLGDCGQGCGGRTAQLRAAQAGAVGLSDR